MAAMLRSSRAILAALGTLAAAATLSGCGPRHPAQALSRAELVKQYNANAAAVPRLWARAKLELKLPDRKGGSSSWGSTSPLSSPNGLLLLAKDPGKGDRQDFVLMGLAPGAVELFRLGSSATEGVYYLWYNYGDRGAAWWGRHEYAGAPGVEMPLDPADLLSVLSITEMPQDFTRLPTMALRLNESPPAYVLTHLAAQPARGEIIFRREVYLNWDDKPPRPFLVNLFDAEGRVIMIARLKDYRPVQIAPAGVIAPVMPADIEITWPQRRGSLHIVLSEMSSVKDWNRRQFLFEHNLPRGIALENITQVDKDPKAEEGPQ
jgi:hypothetical protein